MGKTKDIKYGFTGSGGGAKGAWAAGVAHYLVNDLGRKYDYLSGTSTGSLLINNVATGDTLKLKEGYTSVNNNKIYKLSPYRIDTNNNGVVKVKMNYIKIGWNMLVRGQKTFGDSTKLRNNLLPKFFTKDDFDKLRLDGIEMIACVTNITKSQTEYKSSLEEEYEDFLDWIFASTCAAPFMSIVEKNGCDYADGGYYEAMPLQVLIDRGCTEIDAIDLSEEMKIERVRNPLHLIERLLWGSIKQNAKHDLRKANIEALEKDVVINVYKPSRTLTNNSLVFNKELMNSWWHEGYSSAKEQNLKKESYMLFADSRKRPQRID